MRGQRLYRKVYRREQKQREQRESDKKLVEESTERRNEIGATMTKGAPHTAPNSPHSSHKSYNNGQEEAMRRLGYRTDNRRRKKRANF